MTGREYNIKAFNKDKNSLKYYLRKAIKEGKMRRAQEVLTLIEQWEAVNARAKLEESAKKQGLTEREAQYTFRGSRYYE